MLRDRLIDGAIRLGIDEQLRTLRAAVVPTHREQRHEDQRLRLLLESRLRPDSNCIDIGCYRGRVLVEILRVAPLGKHIAYEPLPHFSQDLAARFPAVDVRQAAVSNFTGVQSYVYVKNMPARSGLRVTSYPAQAQLETLEVRTERLDDSLPDGYAPELIKIDVEGAEGLVFEGALETITKYKPLVIFEHGKAGKRHFNTKPADVYRLLHDEAGLSIFDLDGNGPYSLADLEETCAENRRWDFVAYA